MSQTIRTFSEDDDIVAITELIHAAYAQYTKAGLRYWGTHQTSEDTKKRFKYGIGVVMLQQDEYIGTLTIRPPQAESKVQLYRQQDVWSLSQFCISPKYQGLGYGKILHSYAISIAAKEGASFIALDTAASVSALISMYQTWDYEIVGSCDWRPQTNYESVLMQKPIGLPARM